MFILMLIAIYGIIGELSSPGDNSSRRSRAIALILALYLAAILPVNRGWTRLDRARMMLFISICTRPRTAYSQSAESLAFLIGSLMLFTAPIHSFDCQLSFIIPATLVTAAFFFRHRKKGCARNCCR